MMIRKILFGVVFISQFVLLNRNALSVPNDQVRDIYILLDGVPIFSARHLMEGRSTAAVATETALDIVFSPQYPLDASEYKKDGRYHLKGKVSVDFAGLYRFDLEEIALESDMRISSAYKEKLLDSFDGGGKGSIVARHSHSFFANQPYEGWFSMYIFVDGEFRFIGSDEINKTEGVAFEKQLLEIPLRKYGDKKRGTRWEPYQIELHGDILIMTQGAICFLDDLKLVRSQHISYVLTKESVEAALKAAKTQNLTKAHLWNFYNMTPFDRPSNLPK